MSVAILKLGGKEYVVVPRKRYEQLTRAKQDALDGEIARKAITAFRAGKLKTIPLEKARQKWRVQECPTESSSRLPPIVPSLAVRQHTRDRRRTP